MTEKVIRRKLRRLQWAGICTCTGPCFLLLSPMVYVSLCLTGRLSMIKIHKYGLIWIAVCTLLGLLAEVRGMLLYRRERLIFEEPLRMKKAAYRYLERYLHIGKVRLISHILSGACIGLLSIFPILTMCHTPKTDYKLMEVCCYCTFLLIGTGLLLISCACVNFAANRKVKYIASQEEEVIIRTRMQKVREVLGLHRKLVITVVATMIVMGIFLVMNKGTWYLQPYISTIPRVSVNENTVTYDEKSGIYSIQRKEGKDFKILQLTDIHLGGSALSYSKDLKALQAVYRLIAYTKPDLVIVTGDFVYPVGIESFSFDNYTPILQFASFMRNMGICWAFTYGNHDTEYVASHSESDLNHLLSQFSYDTTKSLLYPKVQPAITGRSNQVILIKNPDGTINQALYLLDSNAYSTEELLDYDYIHDDQVVWYGKSLRSLEKQQKRDVSSMIFTHIPLQEYKTAYELYKNGSDQVRYYFGTNGEDICSSSHESILFDIAVKLQSTKAVFVGHDHYNNSCLEYKGIKLTYGMSIDYLAVPGIAKKTEQRGGTLISLHKDSTFDISQIPLTSIP